MVRELRWWIKGGVRECSAQNTLEAKILVEHEKEGAVRMKGRGRE
jgi:hypothetical protein